MGFVRAYLRASTDEQDANRARSRLDQFASEKGVTIASYYVESESGAALQRPELFRLLSDCREGDTLLVEQVDRLSRLSAKDWEKLRHEIKSRGVQVVALDLPTSWAMLGKSATGDSFTARMFTAINDMMLDMLAAIARKDYEDRRRRVQEGITKAKARGVYKGRPVDTARNADLMDRLSRGQTWAAIVAATGCSRSTLSRLSKRIPPQ